MPKPPTSRPASAPSTMKLNKLGLCKTCNIQSAKYRCPACSFTTCSLPCVKEHKRADKCPGVRNRVAKVAKSAFNENHFMSDISFLQETSQMIDTATRTRALIEGDEIVGKGEARRLTLAAEDRGIRLTYMSKGLARHKRNTTAMRTVPHYRTTECGIKSSKLIYWHLDVYFSDPSGDYSGSQLVKLENIAEDTVLGTIASKGLQMLCKRNKRLRSTPFISTREHNSIYDNAKVSDLDVYLENEFVPMSSIPIPVTKKLGSLRYDPLDTNRTLLSILKGRAVIEFPILRIAPKHSSASLVLARELFGFFELPDAEDDDSSSDDSDSDSESEESTSETASRGKETLNQEMSSAPVEINQSNAASYHKSTDKNSSSMLADIQLSSCVESEKSISQPSPKPAERKLMIPRSVPANEIKARNTESSKGGETKLISIEKKPDDGNTTVSRRHSKNESTMSAEAKSSAIIKHHDDAHSTSDGKSKVVEKKVRTGVRRSRFGSISQINHGTSTGSSGSNADSVKGRPSSNRNSGGSSKSEHEESKDKKRKVEMKSNEIGIVKDSPSSGFDSETHPALFDAPLPEGRVPRKKARI